MDLILAKYYLCKCVNVLSVVPFQILIRVGMKLVRKWKVVDSVTSAGF